jgi:hypothetical protein
MATTLGTDRHLRFVTQNGSRLPAAAFFEG